MIDSRRAPFGWPTLKLIPGEDCDLQLDSRAADFSRGGWLRITTSIDDREEKILQVISMKDGSVLGEIDLKFAHSLEPYQFRMEAEAFEAASRHGLRLRLSQASGPLWILAEGLPEGAASLEPHLLGDLGRDKISAFYQQLSSIATAQPFGWMEGCVLDAQHDCLESSGYPSWRDALSNHFALYINSTGELSYEGPRGTSEDGRIYGIEGALPFAILAKLHPDHQLVEDALQFYLDLLYTDGRFRNPELISAEGSYTIAYPLAVIAQQRGSEDLAHLAANVLRVRRHSLWRPEGLWLRHHPDNRRTFRSWARGVAWYLEGLVRTIEHVDNLIDTADLKADLIEVATWAMSQQRASGLWGCFIDLERTDIDTSGSAGIAAMFARGANLGMLGGSFDRSARSCWHGLTQFLTPDGFLDGAAQSNRGGLPLQEGTYRVLSSMGMGLMGQLGAAIGCVR